jgi:type I site-specific restriction endonuclease
MPDTPEQKARREIDLNLAAAGWLVQSRDEIDLTASRGIAVREFQMKPGFGFADYLLFSPPARRFSILLHLSIPLESSRKSQRPWNIAR